MLCALRLLEFDSINRDIFESREVFELHRFPSNSLWLGISAPLLHLLIHPPRNVPWQHSNCQYRDKNQSVRIRDLRQLRLEDEGCSFAGWLACFYTMIWQRRRRRLLYTVSPKQSHVIICDQCPGLTPLE